MLLYVIFDVVNKLYILPYFLQASTITRVRSKAGPIGTTHVVTPSKNNIFRVNI